MIGILMETSFIQVSFIAIEASSIHIYSCVNSSIFLFINLKKYFSFIKSTSVTLVAIEIRHLLLYDSINSYP